jgi:hypothetical protein
MFSSQSLSQRPYSTFNYDTLNCAPARVPVTFIDESNNNNSFLGGFSSGSSLRYAHCVEHSCSRVGQPSSIGHPSSTFTPNNATGLAIAPASRIGVQAEPVQDPQQSWPWLPVPAQMHAHAHANSMSTLSRIDKKQQSDVQSASSHNLPANLLLNSMAVLLHPDAFADHAPPLPSPPSSYLNSNATLSTQSNRLPDQDSSSQVTAPSRSREKKHGCWMCHKSFDRPSTLRKVCTNPRVSHILNCLSNSVRSIY